MGIYNMYYYVEVKTLGSRSRFLNVAAKQIDILLFLLPNGDKEIGVRKKRC